MGEYYTEIVMNFYIYGGNEQSSYKYVSELLGKETIDTNTYGKSTGHSGNYSTNYQLTGRELMTQDEVRMLDNSKAILLIRGEKPIIDDKYDIMKHPNIKYTTDGGIKPYEHGTTEKAIVNIQKVNNLFCIHCAAPLFIDLLQYFCQCDVSWVVRRVRQSQTNMSQSFKALGFSSSISQCHNSQKILLISAIRHSKNLVLRSKTVRCRAGGSFHSQCVDNV